MSPASIVPEHPLRGEAAREAGELVDALVETLGAVDVGFWEIELATGASRWNEAAFRLMGYAPGEVAPSQERFEAHVHPDDVASIRATALRPRFTLEYRVLPPAGGVRWVRSSNNTVFDALGRPVRIRGIFVDVTEEKRTARRVEQLAAIASRTQNAVIVTDAHGRIEWVNDGFSRLTEFALEEAVGKHPGTLLQGPETSPEVVATMRAAIAAREPFDVVVLNYTKSGRQYWVRLETRPTYDARGELTGFIAIETDVTEARIAASRDSLAERVAALLLRAETVPEAGAALVNELVLELDVRAAQLWLVEPGSPTLVYLAGASADPSASEWVAISADLPFREGGAWVVGVGAPGTAWGTRATFTQTDFWKQDTTGRPSRRSLAAKRGGIRTVCAVPVLGPSGVLAVIEIGGSHAYPGYERLPSVLERVAEQLAAFLLQDASRRAFQAVFLNSPDALLLVDAAGVVGAVNARAEATFGRVRGEPLDALIDGAWTALTRALEAPTGAVPSLLERTAKGASGRTFPAELTIAVTPGASTQAAIVAVRDLTDRRRMEAELERSLREKDTLVQEVHHRVKNNLQIISSMVALQADTIAADDVRSALLDTAARVQSMALVHQQLYANDDLSRIRFGEYAASLCATLKASLDPSAEFQVEADEVDLTIERAVPCGLVLNELVTNALKHGRSPDGRCRLRIRIERRDADFSFVVADGGPGIVAKEGPSTSIGRKLVDALVRQLRARITTRCDAGTEVRVDLPVDDPAPRRSGAARAQS